MRVRYIGDARVISGVGMLAAGVDYDLPDDVAASLCEQGRAVLVAKAAPKSETPAVSRASGPRARAGDGDE